MTNIRNLQPTTKPAAFSLPASLPLTEPRAATPSGGLLPSGAKAFPVPATCSSDRIPGGDHLRMCFGKLLTDCLLQNELRKRSSKSRPFAQRIMRIIDNQYDMEGPAQMVEGISCFLAILERLALGRSTAPGACTAYSAWTLAILLTLMVRMSASLAAL